MTNILVPSALWQRVFRTRAQDTLPHTVSHQRIYIVPSKRGCGFLFTLLLMLVASINYALSLGYALSFVLTGLFAATLLHTYRNLAGLSVASIDTRNTFAGEFVNFDVTLLNQHARSRHGIRLTAHACDSAMARVDALGKVGVRISIRAESRGVCRLGRLTLQSDWPLGLWTCWSYLHVPSQCLVFPQPEPGVPPLPSQLGADEGERAARALTGDVSGLRDYQPGDSMGSIAWKSAARGLGLQSRTFDTEDASAHTVLDLQHAGTAGIESQLSRLCAWVLKAEELHTDYGLQLTGYSLEKGRGREHKNLALQALALYGSNSNSNSTSTSTSTKKS